MARHLNPLDVARLGPEAAQVKATVPRKRWLQIVAAAHKRGFTVAGQLSGAPDALKERTTESLRQQATRTVAEAYKPALAELDRRALAQQYLAQKRQADDAAYRTWLMGEAGKLDAQARAADATLASQQQQIASDLTTAQAAARADSLKRVAEQAGNVSDPTQSTALDYSAADKRSSEQVAAAREHTAQLSHIGADARQMSQAALVATAAVREATSAAENWKALAGIATDRNAVQTAQAKDTAGMLSDLAQREVSKAQSNREFGLAEGQLGVKRDDIVMRYKLDHEKLGLAKWKAQHGDLIAKAKLQLGYDQIAARHGEKAADRALSKWIAEYRAKHSGKGGSGGSKSHASDPAGVGSEERKLYRTVETVRSQILHLRSKGLNDAVIRQRLHATGFDNVTIDVANDLTQNGNAGVLSPAGLAKAKRLGIEHTGYFWGVDYPHAAPSPDRPT